MAHSFGGKKVFINKKIFKNVSVSIEKIVGILGNEIADQLSTKATQLQQKKRPLWMSCQSKLKFKEKQPMSFTKRQKTISKCKFVQLRKIGRRIGVNCGVNWEESQYPWSQDITVWRYIYTERSSYPQMNCTLCNEINSVDNKDPLI